MLLYLLIIGSVGGCLYLLSFVYSLMFKRLNKRKLQNKAEFKKEIRDYEKRNT